MLPHLVRLCLHQVIGLSNDLVGRGPAKTGRLPMQEPSYSFPRRSPIAHCTLSATGGGAVQRAGGQGARQGRAGRQGASAPHLTQHARGAI